MVAYTGGAMRLGGWPYPVVVDLAGMRVTRKSRPILKDHDRGSIVGHTDDITINDRSLEVAGVISGVGATAARNHRHQRKRLPVAGVAWSKRRQGGLHPRRQNGQGEWP